MYNVQDYSVIYNNAVFPVTSYSCVERICMTASFY